MPTRETHLPSLPASGRSVSHGLFLALIPQAPLIGTGDKKEHSLVQVIPQFPSIYPSFYPSIHHLSIQHPSGTQHPSYIIHPLIYPTSIIPFIHPSSTYSSSVHPANIHSPIIHIPQHVPIHATSLRPYSTQCPSIHPSLHPSYKQLSSIQHSSVCHPSTCPSAHLSSIQHLLIFLQHTYPSSITHPSFTQ